ncbi:MAG: hypothetical protein M0Z51_16220 [Propionibacterium sp.]|nr:hypothetical protein [Propionibacterium sp.]
MPNTSPLAFGLVFAGCMAPSVLGAPISGRFTRAGAQRLGLVTFLAGVTTLLTGIVLGSLPVFLMGSVFAWGGQGIAMSGDVRGLLHGSNPADRAPMFAAIFLISHSGAPSQASYRVS